MKYKRKNKKKLDRNILRIYPKKHNLICNE